MCKIYCVQHSLLLEEERTRAFTMGGKENWKQELFGVFFIYLSSAKIEDRFDYLILLVQFQGCRDHTTGNYCDRCEEGFVGNATDGECTSITNGDENFSCECNQAGSLSAGKLCLHYDSRLPFQIMSLVM